MPTIPLEVLLAFVGGILTVASPCTLPILPVVLAVGATGGRRRLAGLLAGFSAVFVLATVAVAGVLAATGLSTSGLRTVAVIALAVAGLLIAWPRLADRIRRAATIVPPPAVAVPLGPRPAGGGFAAGFAIGASTGLIWAPCTGPVMAGVIASAVVEGPSLGGLAIATAYVIGASVSLAVVALVSATAIRRFGSPASRGVRRSFGVALIASALLLAGVLPRSLDPSAGAAAAADAPIALGSTDDADGVPLDDLGPAPELDGITAWINGGPQTIAGLRGKVVLVQFWTFACINCQHVLPYVKAWDAAYRDAGLVVIGVHTPELSFERDLDNVRKAVADDAIHYPIAFDPDYRTWRAYGNHYWPAFYFVDRSGHVRHTAAGEGGYAQSEAVIRQLLAEGG